MPSKSDTIPAMLTPGEVVLNEKQQKALEKYVGQSREEIFGKIKVPGFNIGGKVKYKKYYKKGGKAKEPYYATTRTLALRVYRKETEGKPLVGYEKEYSKSGSYKVFREGLPYGEEGRKKRGETLAKPAEEKAKRMKAAGYKLPPGLKEGGKVKNQRVKPGSAAHQEEVYQFEQHQRDQVKAKARIRKQQKAYIAWAEKQKKLSPNAKKVLENYKREISQDKTPPGLKGGGKAKEAYKRMYKAKWGG